MGNTTKSKRSLFIFAAANCMILFMYAAYSNMWGGLTPSLMNFFSTNNTEHGLALSLQSVGGLVMTVYALLAGNRINKFKLIKRMVALMGLCALAMGSLGFLDTPLYLVFLLFMVLNGYAVSSFDILVNASLPEVLTGKLYTTTAPLVHAFYGVGAMLMPALVGVMVSNETQGSFSRAYFFIVLIALISLAIYAYADRDMNLSKRVSDTESKGGIEILKDSRAWLLLLSGFLYFSFQISYSAWAPSYFMMYTNLNSSACAMSVTVCFAGALLMRFYSSVLFRKVSPEICFLYASIISAIIFIATIFISSTVLLFIMIFIGGFAQGLCAVVLFMSCPLIFPENSSSACAVMVLACNLSSFIMPTLVGNLAQTYGFKVPFALLYIFLGISGFVCYMTTKKHKQG